VARLYAIPGSHPCAVIESALELKGIDYERVDLIPVLHKAIQQVRFGEPTVPGLDLDGERVVGSTRITRRLDELEPEPPLFPRAEAERWAVEELERWGDEVLQPLARRLAWATLRRQPADVIVSYTVGTRLPLPDPLVRASSPLIARISAAASGASDDRVRRDLAELPGHLDRVDAAIASGLLGGNPANAADLQIGSSVRVLLTLGDVRPLLEGRPCAELGERLFPRYQGSAPAGALPAVT